MKDKHFNSRVIQRVRSTSLYFFEQMVALFSRLVIKQIELAGRIVGEELVPLASQLGIVLNACHLTDLPRHTASTTEMK